MGKYRFSTSTYRLPKRLCTSTDRVPRDKSLPTANDGISAATTAAAGTTPTAAAGFHRSGLWWLYITAVWLSKFAWFDTTGLCGIILNRSGVHPEYAITTAADDKPVPSFDDDRSSNGHATHASKPAFGSSTTAHIYEPVRSSLAQWRITTYEQSNPAASRASAAHGYGHKSIC